MPNKIESEVTKAMGRYQKLLDHYKISQGVQEKIWGAITSSFVTDRDATIAEIDLYWEETFGSNGGGKMSSTSSPIFPESGQNSLTGLSRVEEAIYQHQRNHWVQDREIKRAGSRKKAGL